jgi:hypothetical protein
MIGLQTSCNSNPSPGERLASFAADAALGFLAMVIVVPVCFFIPGAFMAWEPWAAVTAALLFFAGLLRGGSPPQNCWAKAARIAFGAWMLAVVWLGRANG